MTAAMQLLAITAAAWYKLRSSGRIRRLRPPTSVTIDEHHSSASGSPSMEKLDSAIAATPCSAEAKDCMGCNAPQLIPSQARTANASGPFTPHVWSATPPWKRDRARSEATGSTAESETAI